LSAGDDKEAFLSRWSRRKLEAKESPATAPEAERPAAAKAAPPAEAAEPAAAEPHLRDSAGYREFFDPRVDEKLRRAALKGLFSDPHFNIMDGLDTYIDDYSIADPIPEAMLRRLNQAKELFLFDDEKETTAEAGDAAAQPSPESESAVALPTQSSVDGAGDGIGAAIDATSTASAKGGNNT